MEALYGTWRLIKSSNTNMPAFFDAYQMPDAMRSVFSESEYEVTYSKDQDNDNKLKVLYKVTNSPNCTSEHYDVELGKEFDFKGPEDEPLKGFILLDGKRIIEKYTDAKGNTIIVDRDFADSSKMKVTRTCNGVSMTCEWEMLTPVKITRQTYL